MTYIDNDLVTMKIEEINNAQVTVNGKVKNHRKYKEIEIFAANPINKMMNYSGSGLPYPCPAIPFENTPNRITSVDEYGNFNKIFLRPNSYYTECGQEKVKPSIYVKLIEEGKEPLFVRSELEDKQHLRTLFYRPERTGPDFYERKAIAMDVQNQEDILRQTREVKIKYGCA